MVAVGRRRERTHARAEFPVAEERADERAEPRVRDLLADELEKAVELVEVTPGLRDEGGGVCLRGLERADVELEAVAEALDPREHAHGVSLAEPPVEHLYLVPDARLDSSGRVDELEREVRASGTRPKATLARDREDALDDPVFDEFGDRRSARSRDGHHGESMASGGWPTPAIAWAGVARLKAFRALRYDPGRAGPLDHLVAPPHDVITSDLRARLEAASPYNAVRLVRPRSPSQAARTLREWIESGVLVRESEPAVWALREDFIGPDGQARTRRGLVARIRLEPYGAGVVLPHERTLPRQKRARLSLLRAVRTKLSPVLLLHEGASPTHPGKRPPELDATLDGVRSRLWRIREDDEIERALEAAGERIIIADGHHRYETALRFHEEDGTEETAYLFAALVSRRDPGLVIFPTHRLALGPVPELNGRFRLTELPGGASEGLARLAGVPRNRPAFVMLRPRDAVLAEAEPDPAAPAALDTAVIDELSLDEVRFTPSAGAAEQAVRSGRASAAFLVRAPTMEQVEAVALAGETMPEKSTYFYPKLTSGLLFSPFDE